MATTTKLRHYYEKMSKKTQVFSVSHFTSAFSMKYITIFLQISSPGLARLYKSTLIKYNVGRPFNSWVSQN